MVDRPGLQVALGHPECSVVWSAALSLLSFRSGRVSAAPRRDENRDRAGAYRPPESLMYRLVLPVQGLALVW